MSILAETENTLREQIKEAVLSANLALEQELPQIILEKPKDKQHGDFASNIAMQLARIAKKAPRIIAEEIVEHLDQTKASIEKIEIAGPGFINFFMKSDFLGELLPVILESGDSYGKSDYGKGERVQVEFVSVNPTGEPHLGHARGAAYGDALCNVLAATGHQVEREYYINDAGNQIDNLALSIEARYLEKLDMPAQMPEDGYFGQDIIEIAQTIIEEDGDKWIEESKEKRVSYFKEYGLAYLLGRIKEVLLDFRVTFDNWFSERSLYEGNQIPDVLQTLEKKNYVFERDGAT